MNFVKCQVGWSGLGWRLGGDTSFRVVGGGSGGGGGGGGGGLGRRAEPEQRQEEAELGVRGHLLGGMVQTQRS